MKFLELLNEKTKNKYSFLKVSKIDIDTAKKVVDIFLIMPHGLDENSFGDTDKAFILDFTKNIMPNEFSIELHYKKTTFSLEQIKIHLIEFLKENYISLLSQFDLDSLSVSENAKTTLEIKFFTHICKYCEGDGFVEKFRIYLSRFICADIEIVLIDIGAQGDIKLRNSSNQLLNINRRKIDVFEKEKIAGKTFGSIATYICDIKRDYESITLAGKVSNITRRTAKASGKVFYTFDIDDTTGSIATRYFSRSTQACVLDNKLKDGDTIIAQGKVGLDSFIKNFSFMVSDIAHCKIDFETIKTEDEGRLENEFYVYAKPQEYIVTEQANLFESNVEVIPEYFQGKTFIVFDLETTGLDPESDMITEIGAIKIVDGKAVESFTTLVNPRIPIPPRVSEVTNITDDMVKNSPVIEEVFQDFYKFTKDITLVGHNIKSFDLKFIRRFAENLKYKMNNDIIDTLELSRKAIKSKKHSLGFLSQYFNIQHTDAHRAMGDVEANVKIFIKLIGLQK